MKVLNIKNGRRSAQSGFTIIELVVVILLLGILTATALPRFMDVTDEAHAAVTEGVVGGLATGMALFHAQWVAEGEVASPVGFGLGNLDANAAGYPEAIDGLLNAAADCVDIFNNVLQAGASTIAAGADIVADNVLTDGDVNGISTTDFVAFLLPVAGTVCSYAYTGQFTDASTAVVPLIEYDMVTGAVTFGTPL